MNEIYRDASPAVSVAERSLSMAAVSWGAVLAGAAATAAFALILLTLGSGLGLSALSPWSTSSHEVALFGFAAIVWICVTQILTCGLGGYIAGRLRTRWGSLHRDETYFRDTVHGFLAWSIATLFTAGILGSVVGNITHAGTEAAAALTSSSVSNTDRPAEPWPVGYLADSLFRMPAGVSPDVNAQATPVPRAEVIRILENSAASRSSLSSNDSAYLARLIARRTGLAESDAQARVTTTYNELLTKLQAADNAAKVAADKARRAAIHISLWLFISMLMGAFSASLMATHGGRVRDADQIAN